MSYRALFSGSFLAAVAAILFAWSSAGISAPYDVQGSTEPQVRTPQTKPQQTTKRRIQVKPSTRLQPTIAKTMLEVSRTGASEFPDWASSATINGPTSLNFRWTTEEVGVGAGIWRVTLKPFEPGSTPQVYASGNLPKPPGKGKNQGFSIDFRKFTPAVAPKEPYFLRYYVSVFATDEASGEDRTPSRNIEVTYRQPGPDTKFTEDMENDPASEAIVLDVYKRLKSTFEIGEPLGPVITGTRTLRGWAMFESPNGPVSIEAHVTAVTDPPLIYVAVPQKGTGIPSTYHWFQYTYDTTGLIPVFGDQYPPPGYDQPVMSGTRDWCHDDTYDVEAVELDDDPPHWSPFLIRDSGYDALGRISYIHSYFQRLEDKDKARSMIGNHRQAVLDWDPELLGERSTNAWPAVTLRGLVQEAGFPGGDFGGDHTTNYIPPGEDSAPSGGLVEESDHTVFPGMDWDVKVIPDSAYTYLASITRRTSLQVEIEHFALPHLWRPQEGEWVQAVGRWVVDCGHRDGDSDDYYTEIHPPELLVTTEPQNAFGSRARVAVTGAWLGRRQTFVVNPPARPSPTSVLKYGVDTTWAKAAELSLEAVPATDPNHLLVSVRKTTGYRPLTLHSDGRVSMRRQGYRGFVRVWWDESLATVNGRATGGNLPAVGTFIFYRDATIANSTWRRVRVGVKGYYRIQGLAKGGSYQLVAGGSGWDFDKTPASVILNEDIKTVDFHGQRAAMQTKVGPRFVVEKQQAPVFRSDEKSSQPAGTNRSAIQSSTVSMQLLGPQATQTLRLVGSMLFSVKEPGYSFGVQANQLGYPESGVVSIHLQGLSDWEGNAITELSSAYSTEGQDPETRIIIEGYPTPGVKKARVRARLLLGNDAAGYRVADVAEGTTNSLGVVAFRFNAGIHVEEAVVDMEIIENPFNPWFKPRVRGNTRLFHPRGGETTAQSVSGLKIAHGKANQVRSTEYSLVALVNEDDLAYKAAIDGFGERHHFAGTVEKTRKVSPQPNQTQLRVNQTDLKRGVSKRVVKDEE